MRYNTPFSRIFAQELQQANLIKNQDKDSRVEVITPSGECLKNLFWCGALTEVQSYNGAVQTIRVADPTGGFTFYIRLQDIEIQDIVKNLEPPVFISVCADAYLKGQNCDLSFRLIPTFLAPIERMIRDQWIIETADLMIDRLEFLRDNLNRISDCEKQLKQSILYYQITPQKLLDLGKLTEHALTHILETTSVLTKCVETDISPDEIVIKLIREQSGPRGIAVQDLVMLAKKESFSEETVFAVIRTLIADDDIYQPSAGYVKLL